MVRDENVVPGLRVMSKANLLSNMKDMFKVVKDDKGHYNSIKSKKLLINPNMTWFKENRPKAFRKKVVVKKIPKRNKKPAQEPAPAPKPKEKPAPKPKEKAPKKKPRSKAQLANDKRLGLMAKARAKAKKEGYGF